MAAHDRTRWVPAPVAGPRRAGGGLPVDPDRPPHERLGRYRLVEEIGEGGMGVVHLALDHRGRAVAIKVLRAHVADDDEARMRLRREVETLSRIRDVRVASVIDADVMAPRPYIVTRYVPGPALDDWVEEHGPLDPDALLRLACGTAAAIRAIHSCGVVHRDIKPGNVLLEDGEPVLIDFGIAHLQDDVRHTMGGLVMGTPGYLSPELVEGASITDATPSPPPADHRSDVVGWTSSWPRCAPVRSTSLESTRGSSRSCEHPSRPTRPRGRTPTT
jgi:serine/threonine protein kinase